MRHVRGTLYQHQDIQAPPQDSGKAAEAAVASYLQSQGLKLLGRNVRVGRLEIDLIVQDGPVIAIVEVRTRGPNAYQRGLDSITARKRKRVRKAGEVLWRARFSKNPSLERMRFDAASVVFGAGGDIQIDYVIAAF